VIFEDCEGGAAQRAQTAEHRAKNISERDSRVIHSQWRRYIMLQREKAPGVVAMGRVREIAHANDFSMLDTVVAM